MNKTGQPAAVLKGYAGTGKTFLTTLLTSRLKEEGYSIGVTAPTHKAVKVLNRRAVEGVDYRTVHSALAMKEVRDFSTGTVSYRAENNARYQPPVADYDILMVDETSMLDDDLFSSLIPRIRRGLKVLFIGDPMQIPPINHTDSIPFLKAEEWGFLVTNLEEVVRQGKGNPILDWATYIRDNCRQKTFTPKTQLISDAEGVKVTKKEDEDEIFRAYFNSENFRQDADHMKVIAWRRETVSKYNVMIRRILYGAGAPSYVVGEKLIMTSSWSSGDKVVLNNNEELVIRELHQDSIRLNYQDTRGYQVKTVKIWNMSVEYQTIHGLRTARIPVIHEGDRAGFERLMKTLASDARRSRGGMKKVLWKSYFTLQDRVAWVNYNYAITAHKAQGSTYQNCLVLKWDLDMNGSWAWNDEELARKIEERNRILYTSCTRPSHLLMIEV